MGKSGDLFMQIMGRYNDMENHFKILEEEYYKHQVEEAQYLNDINDGRYFKQDK